MSTATKLGRNLDVRIEASALAAALRVVAPLAQGGRLPIFSGVRLTADAGKLTLECTSGEQRVTHAVDVGLQHEGQVVVPAKLLGDFARTLTGAVRLSWDEEFERLIVEQGVTRLDLHSLVADEWPAFTEIDGEQRDLTDAWSGIKRVLFARSNDKTEPAPLHGVRFDEGHVVACCKLGFSSFEVPGLKASQVVPGDFVDQIAKQATGQITTELSDAGAKFNARGTQWTTRLVEGTYPKWANVIRAENPQHLTVARGEILGALSRLKLLDDQSGYRRVELRRDGAELILVATGPDVGSITDVISCEGDFDYSMQFEIRLLAGLFDNCVEDEVVLGLAGELKSVQIHEGPWTGILTPLKS